MTLETLETIEPELNDAVATLMADSVVTRLGKEIEKLQNAKQVDANWFNTALDVIKFCSSIEVGFNHGKALMLAVVKMKWEDLPFDVRKQFGLSFMSFANAVTGRKESTINNYINTAKIWLIDKTRPNQPVKVVERDIDGRPIMKGDGTPSYKEVEFNPFSIDMSKLLAVNSRASKGEMTDKLWEMLTDPIYDCEDIQQAHANTPINGVMPDAYYEQVGPGLFYTVGPDSVCVAEFLNWEEYEQNSQVQEGLDRLLKLLHIKTDEAAIFDMVKNYASVGQTIP